MILIPCLGDYLDVNGTKRGLDVDVDVELLFRVNQPFRFGCGVWFCPWLVLDR